MKAKKIIFLIFIILSIFTGFRFFFGSDKNKNNVDQFPSLKFIFNEKRSMDTQLDKIFKNNFENKKGTYAVAIKSLKNNEVFYFNEHKTITTGSLYKLWVMAAVFDQIKQGKLEEDEQLSSSIASLNSKFGISSDSAELTEGSVTLTVKDALFQMITISHNYAAYLLTERIKLSTVKNYLKVWGLNESTVGNNLPSSTAYDISLFFEKLYKRELADKASTESMLLLLKQQKLNNKLPKYLAKDVIIAHKTGELDSFTHDAGIVFTPKGDYIIVVLSDSDAPGKAEENIAAFSKDMYEYFISK